MKDLTLLFGRLPFPKSYVISKTYSKFFGLCFIHTSVKCGSMSDKKSNIDIYIYILYIYIYIYNIYIHVRACVYIIIIFHKTIGLTKAKYFVVNNFKYSAKASTS